MIYLFVSRIFEVDKALESFLFLSYSYGYLVGPRVQIPIIDFTKDIRSNGRLFKPLLVAFAVIIVLCFANFLAKVSLLTVSLISVICIKSSPTRAFFSLRNPSYGICYVHKDGKWVATYRISLFLFLFLSC
jgi:hypothetical protein